MDFHCFAALIDGTVHEFITFGCVFTLRKGIIWSGWIDTFKAVSAHSQFAGAVVPI